MKRNNVCLIIIMLISINSYANERLYDRVFSLKKSSHPVMALKIGGRVDCNVSNSYREIAFDNSCSGVNVTESMKSYNMQKKTEDFLILKSFRGDKKQGDIISVRLKNNPYDFGYMDIGSVYIIFFNKEDDGFYYEHCDVANYIDVKAFLNKDTSFDKFVDILLAKEISICPSFEPIDDEK